MATTVNYVGNNYSVPAYNDTGYAQGAGNLSSYLIALATGSLTLSGGSFPLTADANFGSSFGLVALYYKSVASNIATTGILRMANAASVGWRNGLNNGNVTLSVDSSDRLAFSGNDIILATPAKGLVLTTPDGLHTVRISVTNVDGDGNVDINVETIS